MTSEARVESDGASVRFPDTRRPLARGNRLMRPRKHYRKMKMGTLGNMRAFWLAPAIFPGKRRYPSANPENPTLLPRFQPISHRGTSNESRPLGDTQDWSWRSCSLCGHETLSMRPSPCARMAGLTTRRDRNGEPATHFAGRCSEGGTASIPQPPSAASGWPGGSLAGSPQRPHGGGRGFPSAPGCPAAPCRHGYR